MQIGNIHLKSPVMLAPMCGYTDLTFRLAVRKFGGTGLAFTEMINPRSVIYGGGRKRAILLASNNHDAPLCYQIYGNEPMIMAEAANWLIANKNAILIDINMGCPQRKIAGRGAGAGLLRNPAEAVKLAETIVKSVSVPVTAKLRAGVNESDPFLAARLAPDLEKAGIAAITVHGRTLDQRYSGTSNLDAIRGVAEAVRNIPIIGNGDLSSPEAAKAMISKTGCAGIMIGRASLKQPWLMRDISCALAGKPVPAAPSRREHIDFMISHFDALAEQYGNDKIVLTFRRWIPQYAKALQINRDKMLDLLKTGESKTLRAKLDEYGADG